MKIVIVFHNLSFGGIQRVIAELATGLAAAGHDLEILLTGQDGSTAYEVVPSVRVRALGITRPTVGSIDSVAANLTRVIALRRAIADAKPDVVIAHEWRTNILVVLATRATGRHVVITEHSDPVHSSVPAVWRCLRRLIYPLADRLVSVSHGVDRHFAWLPPDRRRVITNPIPRTWPAPTLAYGDRPNLIVGMGRLVPQKGFDLLIDAFSMCTRTFPDWRLEIWGDGPERQRLQSRITELGVKHRVRLCGVTDRPDEVLGRAALFVLSSRFEGFGNVLVEALAMGTPVVAADCPFGPSEIVRPGVDGLLVHPECVDALSRAMMSLFADPGGRATMSTRAVEARERFSYQRFLERWIDVIEAP